MVAFVINEIVVTEPERFQTYADQVPAILTAYGGEYMIRGGAPEPVDGPPPPERLVVLRFPSREAARAWRASPEYLAILPIREATSTSRVYIVDGYGPSDLVGQPPDAPLGGVAEMRRSAIAGPSND